ncbi:HCNGP-like protein-domain-containing protein [Astrocystis sublimbata]|nr:HCNGP-like protein-domain-containing protein [Astrocystis sublimbata]
MAGLVAYESSDEEDEVKPQTTSEPPRKNETATADSTSTPSTTTIKDPSKIPSPKAKANVDEGPAVYGPQMGPSSGPSFPPLEEDPAGDAAAAPLLPQAPGSPYTATRALLRDLTLPAVPDMDIPPSPPASPPPSKKLENFLELKKKGVHFNARLADTTSMKNPALVDKLMAFAELDHRDQYRTTLAADLSWDPDIFPRQAYKEQLRQSQSDIAAARTRAAGEAVKFVPSEWPGPAAEDGSKTAQAQAQVQASVTGKRKTRFDK